MAKRRRRGVGSRLLAGVGEGLANLGPMMLRQQQMDRMDERAERSAADVATRQQQNAERAAVMQVRQAIAEGKIDPEQGAALIGQVTGGPQDPESYESMRPSPQRRMAPSMERVLGAKNLTDIDPDEAIAASGRAAGLGMPQEWLIPGATTNDPFAEFGGDERGAAVRQVGEVAGARRRSFMNAPEWTDFEDPISGVKGKRTISMGDPNASTGIALGPTAEQQGVIAGTKQAAEDMTVLGNDALTEQKGKTQARLENIVEGLTRQAKVQTAAATAGAAKRATLAPDIVASEVSRQTQLSAGKDQSTDSERRAATNWAPLLNAHEEAMTLEDAGARIAFGAQTAVGLPGVNALVPEQQQEYIRAMNDFISTLGLIRSGVSVPKEERANLVSTMFGVTGDGPQNIKNKQASREVFLGAMQAMVGRSADDAGRLLAEAINRGQIQASILASVKLEPAIEKAVLANLRGIPRFDINGRPIGVNPGQ